MRRRPSAFFLAMLRKIKSSHSNMSMHSSLYKVAVASVELGSFFAGGGALWVVGLASVIGRRDEGRI